MIDAADATARLKDFQRRVRDALVQSRARHGLHEVSRASRERQSYSGGRRIR